MPLEFDDHPFWDYSLRTYAGEGVAAACLGLGGPFLQGVQPGKHPHRFHHLKLQSAAGKAQQIAHLQPGESRPVAAALGQGKSDQTAAGSARQVGLDTDRWTVLPTQNLDIPDYSQ